MRIINDLKLKNNIEKSVLKDIAEGKVGAAAVCVMQNGKTVYENFFSGDIIKINEKTLFRLASMTKPVTAVAVMKLAERGLVSLDEPVSNYIPEFKEMFIGEVKDGKVLPKSKVQTAITLRHALTHTSGIGSGATGEILMSNLPPEKRENLQFMMKYFTDTFLDFEPFSAQMYSGTFAFDIIARVVEIVSKKSYDEYLKTEIFEPLGMNDTAFVPTAEQWQRMIPMHKRENGKSAIEESFEKIIFSDFPKTYFCAGAGLFSSLSDYSKFALMLQNKGELNGVRILSSESVKEMSTIQVPKEIMEGNERWGLSVRVIADESYENLPVGSFGWSGAYGSHFWIDKENGITAVYMKNSLYDGGAGSVTSRQFEKDVFEAME